MSAAVPIELTQPEEETTMLPRNAEYLFLAYGFAVLAISGYGLWIYLKLRAVVSKTARLRRAEGDVS